MARQVSSAANPTLREAIQKIAPCETCGYDLHGLPPDGRCPECGSVIDPSLRRELIRFGHPGWVSGLHRGSTLLLCGPALAGVAVLLVPLLEIINRLGRDLLTMLGAVLLVACFSGGGGMFVGGVLLLSRPDPRELPEARSGWLRSTFRWGWLPAWTWVLYVIAEEGGLPRLNTITFVLGILACTTWLAVLILHITQLAGLLTSRSLRRSGRVCLLVLTVTAVSVGSLPVVMLAHGSSAIGAVVVFQTGTPPGPPAGRSITVMDVWLPMLAMVFLGFTASMFVLFAKCRRVFQETLEQARQNWSRPLAGVDRQRFAP